MINIEQELIEEEGLSLEPYEDSLGNLTIGVGHLIKSDCGVITLEYAGKLLAEDIKIAKDECRKNIKVFGELDEVRQYVLVDMCFNLGIRKLLGFKKMLLALENKNFVVASAEMKNSLWHKQVGVRAIKLENCMKNGRI